MIDPYYTDEWVTLYHGEFQDLLPELVEAYSFDLVVADPPYGATSLEWDRWPDGWPSLIPGVSMWCFGSMRLFGDRWFEFRAGGWKFSHDIVWEKHNGSGFAKDRFQNVHEHATHWYRGPWAEVHHEPPRCQTGGKRTTVRRAAWQANVHGARGVSLDVRDGSTLARSVIYARSEHGRSINETQKPVGVLEQMIEYGCPDGGLVLDPFAGACSTLVAARAIGRRAVGIEKREAQCEKAAELRLAQGVLCQGV